jgi:hypothetical protein
MSLCDHSARDNDHSPKRAHELIDEAASSMSKRMVGLAGFEPATHTAVKELFPFPSRWQSGVQPHISRVLHHAELQAHFATARA